MQRFFIDAVTQTGDLPQEVCHQLLHVLRAQAGDHVILLDNSGYEYVAKLTIAGKSVSYQVVEKNENTSEPEVHVTLYQSLLKSRERFELSCQKATELGVTAITPLYTEFCQIKELRKPERVHKIITEAAEQCERGKLPLVHDVTSFNQMIKQLKDANGTIIFCYERMLKPFETLPHITGSVHVVVGPEGGFSPAECETIESLCKEHEHFHMLSLGKRILRSETASIVALAHILTPY